MKLEPKVIETDILIIGGGTAGCYAGITLASHSKNRVLIVDKGHIKRSGCLAAGVNALNAYIVKGQTPETYLDYVRKDAEGVIREDLVLTMARRLNQVTRKMESLGLVILKDEAGEYVARGNRNLKINGENIKPLLAQAVMKEPNIQVLNRVNITDYIIQEGQVVGAYGFSLDSNTFYAISAKSVLCATGGAAGLYRPNNPGFSRHKMWYCPFNTGAGYAMGIRAGAEMTTFEMRFIALRCKDTIAPTGTIAQGIGAPQINSDGQEYEQSYGQPKTSNRLYATVMENRQGRGPCYLKTAGITPQQEEDLFKAYLNMAPAQTLKWIDQGQGPSTEQVEIEGTEPYIVGGHTGSGYWVDTHRATTLKGLYAAGDVAGGSPQKYVTGCFAEAEIAAMSALDFIQAAERVPLEEADWQPKLAEINHFLQEQPGFYEIEELEEAMQKTMDEYAGGIAAGYCYNLERLAVAERRIEELLRLSTGLRAHNQHELMFICEIVDRLYVAKVLIAHLKARQETRWHSFQENLDYPDRNDEQWLKYVNSRLQQGEVQILLRDLVKKDEVYEHKN